MKRTTFLFLLVALLIPLLTPQASAVDLKKGSYVPSTPGPGDFAVSINLLGEKGSVYRPGKDIQLSFQTTKDAYVVVYNIDADGYVHLLYPEDGRSALSEGRKTHFLPPPGKNEYWETGATTGVEYIHAVAVTEPGRINENELYFLAQGNGLAKEKRLRIDIDPFLGFNMIDEEIVSGTENDPPATDYTYFYVNRRVEYPRYLCSKCHSPEKLSDPYAMECPEIVIEKIAYDEEPRYPYPPLYDIRHVGDKPEEDADTSDRYSEKWLDEGDVDNEENDTDDTHLRLSISYGGYNPFWPQYGPTLLAFDPFYWDPFWWDFNWYWGDSFWWPSYGWWYPPSYYWAYHYRYPWWGWDHNWWACDNDWGRRDNRYRPVYGARTVKKRYLDYTRTSTDVRRTRSIAGSRLDQVKNRDVARRLERSNLERRAAAGSLQRTPLRQNDRGVVRSRETDRRVIYGGRSKRGVDRTVERIRGETRDNDRTRNPSDRRTPDSGRTGEDRRVPRARDNPARERSGDSGRDVIRRSAPERKSPDSGKKESTRERSKSDGRSGSNTDKRRISSYSTEGGAHSYQRDSHTAPARGYGAAARPASGGTAPASAKTSSQPTTVKTRSR